MKIKLINNIKVSSITKLRLIKYSCIDTIPLWFPESYCKEIEVDQHLTQKQYEIFERDLVSDEKIRHFGWTVERL